MSLPPLPKKIILHTQLPDHFWHGDVVGHTDAAIQAYGQACREDAFEEAAMAAENGFKYALDGYQIAYKIRSLK